MNKKFLNLLLATTIVVSAQMIPSSFSVARAESVSVDSLVDVSPNHWAYNAVKLVVQDLGILAPKSATRFMGNDMVTRYDVAQSFYNVAKRLESTSGKDLKVSGDKRTVNLTDVDAANKAVVDGVVNEYGLMQAMPGNKFLGNEKMTRYELAFELNNYINLLVKKVGKVSLSPSDKASLFSDLKDEHWATPSVKSLVNNNCQMMSGYPDKTFKGQKTVTRYELASILRKFVDCVDKYLVAVTPVATPVPTVMPTPEATPVATPTPEATPVATPTTEATPAPEMKPAKKPLSTVDLKLGGAYKMTNTKAGTGYLYGPAGQLDLRFGGLQIGLGGDYMLFDQKVQDDTSIVGLARATAGGDVDWRILGTESDEDASLVIGAGWNYIGLMGKTYAYSNAGPKGRLAIEIPVGGLFSLFAEDNFTYLPWENKTYVNNLTWFNDAYAGITIPAYTGFSVQLGYKDTRYKRNDTSNTIFGDIGGLANLRFRF